MSALVTVVVPVFNVRPWLPQCVDSLLAQTYPHVEILLVDDGSTDGSGRLCDEYAVSHENVRVIHKPNRGLSHARNEGLRQALGQWIMFLDGDDWIDPDAVASMLQSAMSVSADVVIVGYHVDTHDERETLIRTQRRAPSPLIIDESAPRAPEVSAELLNFVGYAWNKLYRRSLLSAPGSEFPVGVSLVEDILFNAPVLTNAGRIHFADDAFVHYVQRPRQTLGTQPQPQFANLMRSATEATVGLLIKWGVSRTRVAQVVHDVELARVQWAVRSVLLSRRPWQVRRELSRTLLNEAAVRQVLERELTLRRLHGARRWLLISQLRGHVLPTLAVSKTIERRA